MALQPKAQHSSARPPEPAATTGGPAAQEAGGTLTIDLGALTANYKMLVGRVMPSECAAVVKGDAYGCGIDEVSTALARAGCKTFFVAQLSEARRVRAIAPEAAIYVLNGFSSTAGQGFAETRARPVINSLIELAEWDHFVATAGFDGSAALHVDTGMNRLGLSIEEAAAIASHIQSENHRITLLMSHLACADRPEQSARCFAASPARSPTPPASSSTLRPIAISCVPASRSTVAIRRPASPTRCGR